MSLQPETDPQMSNNIPATVETQNLRPAAVLLASVALLAPNAALASSPDHPATKPDRTYPSHLIIAGAPNYEPHHTLPDGQVAQMFSQPYVRVPTDKTNPKFPVVPLGNFPIHHYTITLTQHAPSVAWRTYHQSIQPRAYLNGCINPEETRSVRRVLRPLAALYLGRLVEGIGRGRDPGQAYNSAIADFKAEQDDDRNHTNAMIHRAGDARTAAAILDSNPCRSERIALNSSNIPPNDIASNP